VHEELGSGHLEEPQKGFEGSGREFDQFLKRLVDTHGAATPFRNEKFNTLLLMSRRFWFGGSAEEGSNEPDTRIAAVYVPAGGVSSMK
jgi:hypothetical protein